ncbi:MAG: uL15 family ribosomal protein [bacterium]|nr:uL15 family ribosomal protein [bacterium]MDZ4284794.1 uL15 family ribosomal protein [Patescibacteria group bacterium]
MQLHQLSRTHTHKHARRVGRGGKRGKTSGRGTKGQRSRAGHRMRPELRDILKKLPKRRGYGKNRARGVNSSRVRPLVLNVSALERTFAGGARVTPASLIAAGLISKRGGKMPLVKILSDGALTKALTVSGCSVSASARAKIEGAGGGINQK